MEKQTFQGAGLRKSDGGLWFPTLQGLANITPAHLTQTVRPPTVIVEQVLAEGKQLSIRNGMTIPAGTKLSDVVKALNSLGATPQDLLAILQAMKSAGALNAELEVI